MTWNWLAALNIALGLLFLQVYRARRRPSTRLPPGPKGLPVIGNAFDMPRKHLGREFSALSAKYGEVMYLDVLGQPMIVLGSYKVARELLDKRSANYSGRPKSIMAELTGLDCMTVLRNYGPEWRKHRRAFGKSFGADTAAVYEPMHHEFARRFLSDLLLSPRSICEKMNFAFTAHVIRVTYDIVLDNRYYEMVERVLEVAEKILTPGRYAVEALPVLRNVPAWFPGAHFKRFAAEARRDVTTVVDRLFSTAKKIHIDTGRDSIVSRLLNDPSTVDAANQEEVERVIKGMAITCYLGGIDTTDAALQAFILAMAMYPLVQQKAQAELDAVVGTSRLPSFADQATLPYMNALLREVLRWHVVTPIGVPHCTSADDEYDGYFIPAGTIVSANIWAMAHDPEVYPNPDEFVPERFLDANGRLDLTTGDPAEFVYGFGRRVCPGRPFAEASMFVLCASILHAFSIRPPLDAEGRPVKLEYRAASNAAISHPEVHDYVLERRLSLALSATITEPLSVFPPV